MPQSSLDSSGPPFVAVRVRIGEGGVGIGRVRDGLANTFYSLALPRPGSLTGLIGYEIFYLLLGRVWDTVDRPEPASCHP